MPHSTRLAILVAAFASLLATGVGPARAQQQGQQSQQQAAVAPAPRTPVSNSIISLEKETDWTLHAEVFLRSFAFRTVQGRISPQFVIERGSVVYPLLEGSASHRVHIDGVESQLFFQNREVTEEYTLLEDYHSGERMGRWDLEDVRGREVRLVVDIPMTNYETRFDEERAFEIGWPTKPLPPVAASTLTPQLYIESNDPRIRALVQEWTKGKPRSVPPAKLAKFLAREVIDRFQPNGDGFAFGRTARFEGMEVAGAAEVADQMRGSPFDMVALTCALYRAAGIPTRLVVGYDVARSLGEDSGIFFEPGDCFPEDAKRGTPIFPIFHSWVEFYLRDEKTGEQAWVPVDVLKQRRVSSRAPDLDDEWRFFGRNECLENILPISFHFHPPTNVVAAGAPAMWGWASTPEVVPTEQNLLYRAMHTPKRLSE